MKWIYSIFYDVYIYFSDVVFPAQHQPEPSVVNLANPVNLHIAAAAPIE